MGRPHAVTGRLGQRPRAARILVVDDDPGARAFVRRALASRGYSVREAEDGRAALRAVFDTPEATDLVVTDVRMPGLNGLELAAMLSVARPEIRMIFLTGEASFSARDAALPGVTTVLAKPVLLDDLYQAVSDAVGEPPPPAADAESP